MTQQRFLANDRNQLRTATLTPSGVQTVTQNIQEILVPRSGKATVTLTGTYTGTEAATYDVMILDNTITGVLISTPVFSGEGSGKLANIAGPTIGQSFSVELTDNGIPLLAAGVDFEGVRIISREEGVHGNSITFVIDQSGLTFTPSNFSLLNDLKAGAGSATAPMKGPEFDWGTKVLGSSANGDVPLDAHRVTFGDDSANIYVAYKEYSNGDWLYHLCPELAVDQPAGTRINFVTGTRSVLVSKALPSFSSETIPDIITQYDMLNWIRNNSLILDIDGVVVNDRTPTGMATLELLTRTDAYAGHSTGTGSKAATGFTDVVVGPDAGTQLIIAECIAVTPSDYPLAHTGHEQWKLTSSLVAGELARVFTGVSNNQPRTYTDPNGDYAFTIPVKLPDNPNNDGGGRFSVTSINYQGRPEGVDPPPICPVALTLGPAATDMTITLTYKKRPTGDCDCGSMTIPTIGGPCIGNDTGGSVAYSGPTITRLIDLYTWEANIIRVHSLYLPTGNQEDAFIATGIAPTSGGGILVPAAGTTTAIVQEGLSQLVEHFEESIAELDALPTSALQTAGFTAWDVAVAELKADIAGTIAGAATYSGPAHQTESLISTEALSAGNAVGVFPSGDGLTFTVRKAIAGALRYGFVAASTSAPAIAKVYYWGTQGSVPGGGTGASPTNTYASGAFNVGTIAYMDSGTAGDWVTANVTNNVASGHGQIASSPVTFIATAAAEVTAGSAGINEIITLPSFENLSAGQAVCAMLDSSGIVSIRKAIAGAADYGFVQASTTAPAAATMYRYGNNTAGAPGSFTVGQSYAADVATPGNWSAVTGTTVAGSRLAIATSASVLNVTGAVNSGSALIGAGPTQAALGLLADRYESRLKQVGMTAGIPQVGKDSASAIVSGDGCWQDYGDAYWWEIVSSTTGKYAPAFNNHVYYACQSKGNSDSAYFATKEFAFQLNIKCTDQLLPDDQIVLDIGGTSGNVTYQIGDKLTLPIIAAQPLNLVGGQDASLQQTWSVTATIAGPLPPFLYDPGSPTSYLQSVTGGGDLGFDLVPGGIPFAKGDKFDFTSEGGHYEWRKNGGSWSSSTVIAAGPTALVDGLSISFTTGATPSFVANDVYSFKAYQPYAASNVQNPSPKQWQWGGTGGNILFDLGTPQVLDTAAIAFHTLPFGATVTLQGGSTTAVADWTESLTWQSGVIASVFTTSHTSRYVKITVANATGGGIGWLWCGAGLTTAYTADIQLSRKYLISRGATTGSTTNDGLTQGGITLGGTASGSVEWSDGSMVEADVGSLTNADTQSIAALFHQCKYNNDQPFILIPQITRISEAFTMYIVEDEIEFTEVGGYQPAAGFSRNYKTKFTMTGVWA